MKTIHSTRDSGNKYGAVLNGLCCYGIRMTDKTEYFIEPATEWIPLPCKLTRLYKSTKKPGIVFRLLAQLYYMVMIPVFLVVSIPLFLLFFASMLPINYLNTLKKTWYTDKISFSFQIAMILYILFTLL